jgi:8-oxo-dGTP pyrophosphatase MutT (NUDIX family)
MNPQEMQIQSCAVAASIDRNPTRRLVAMVSPEGSLPGSPDAVPGEDVLNTDGPVVVPRLAAGVILVRGGDATLELLLVRRTPKARFMGGVWVFPGGALDPADGDGQDGLRAAATRELREEAAIELPPSAELVAFSRWVTPEALPIRFDTVFFVAPAPDGCAPAVDGEEMVDWRWTTPSDALAASQTKEIMLAFPTAHDIEALARHTNATALIDDARSRPVFTTQPVVVIEDGTATVVIPPRDA